MNKLKLLSIIALCLFISNLVLLGLFFFGKPFPKHDGPRNIIIERLVLDEEQISKYDISIQQHRKSIRLTEDEIHQLKNELYKTLNSNSDTMQRTRLISQLGEMQMQIERIHIHHFNEIKALLKPEQHANFEKLTTEIATLFARGPQRKKRQ